MNMGTASASPLTVDAPFELLPSPFHNSIIRRRARLDTCLILGFVDCY